MGGQVSDADSPADKPKPKITAVTTFLLRHRVKQPFGASVSVARRWQQAGVIRQTLRNQPLVTLAQYGVSPDCLEKFYPNVR